MITAAAAWALPLVVLLPGCSGEQDVVPELTLAEASEQVTFASTEALGPHRYQALQERVEYRYGDERSRHAESLEVLWQDWDHFSYQHQVNGQTVESVRVYLGQCWLLRAGEWDAVDDAEPYRTQLRMSWNAWEQVITRFGDRVELTSEGIEPVEGRSAQRYAVSLMEPVAARGSGPRARNTLDPLELQGTLWLDEATAVHLTGRLRGVLGREGYTQEQTVQLARTEIGTLEKIEPPDLGKDQ